jgi:hypothetical protein
VAWPSGADIGGGPLEYGEGIRKVLTLYSTLYSNLRDRIRMDGDIETGFLEGYLMYVSSTSDSDVSGS